MTKSFLLLWVMSLLAPVLSAREAGHFQTWTVDGVQREALVFEPERKPEDATKHAGKPVPAPLVFVFHGHGGGMRHASWSISVQETWPEARVIFPQGLNTPGQLTDKEGAKPGWQRSVGDQGDRDIKLVDAILSGLRAEGKLDAARVYATGHSNGGAFCFVLWEARGELFSGFAPSSAVYSHIGGLKPKPVFMLAGRSDPLVKFSWVERMVKALISLNHCGEPQKYKSGTTEYRSSAGTPVFTWYHNGGHTFVEKEAAPLIAGFFKERCGGAPAKR